MRLLKSLTMFNSFILTGFILLNANYKPWDTVLTVHSLLANHWIIIYKWVCETVGSEVGYCSHLWKFCKYG